MTLPTYGNGANYMHFPKFWAFESEGQFRSWRWSDTSLEEARAKAAEAVKRFAQKFKQGGASSLSRYEYGTQPLREEVLQEIKGEDGEVIGVITRNSYGAEVLNTAKILMLDIDLEPAGSSLGGWIGKLFGNSAEPKPDEAAIIKLKTWCNRNPSWGMNVYRTAAGLRVLVTHAFFEVAQLENDNLWVELGVDPLYRKLCIAQKSYRARLTPKPWRCGCGMPPTRWPWLSAELESKFRAWDQKYRSSSSKNCVTHFIEHIGSSDIPRELSLVVDFHDRATKARAALPLA